jgi:hypothetical protein
MRVEDYQMIETPPGFDDYRDDWISNHTDFSPVDKFLFKVPDYLQKMKIAIPKPMRKPFDQELIEHGKWQARKTAIMIKRYLLGKGQCRVKFYTSPFVRAIQTAAVMAPLLNATEISVHNGLIDQYDSDHTLLRFNELEFRNMQIDEFRKVCKFLTL